MDKLGPSKVIGHLFHYNMWTQRDFLMCGTPKKPVDPFPKPKQSWTSILFGSFTVEHQPIITDGGIFQQYLFCQPRGKTHIGSLEKSVTHRHAGW